MRIFIPKHRHPLVLRKIWLAETQAKLLLYCQECRKEYTEVICLGKPEDGKSTPQAFADGRENQPTTGSPEA